MKKCPYCAEEIQDGAIKCRHCKKLLDQGNKVDLIDNFYRGKKDHTFNSILKEKNVNFYKIDLLKDYKKFNKLSKNYKYIFHLALSKVILNVWLVQC